MDSKLIGIYGLFDKETGECLYIGQSSDINYRIKRHKWKLSNNSHLTDFSVWFNSIGRDLSRIEDKVLDECVDDDTVKNDLEIFWFYQMSPRFYGKVPSTKESWQMSTSTREKISESLVKYWKNFGPVSGQVKKSIVNICEYCSKEFSSEREAPRFCSVPCVQKSKRASLDKDLICGMYAEGKNLREIAKVVGTSHITVRTYLIDYGVTLRAPGERG